MYDRKEKPVVMTFVPNKICNTVVKSKYRTIKMKLDRIRMNSFLGIIIIGYNFICS